MQLAETLLISVLSSATVAALLVFFVRRYLGRQIDWQFKRRELEYEAELRRRAQVDAHYLTERLGIYPEIAQITYRLRKLVNDGMARAHISQWDDELPPLCGELTQGLVRWRYYLPPVLFSDLHDFKRAVQDVLVFYDIRTRPSEFGDDQAYAAALEQLRPTVAELNRLHDALAQKVVLERQAEPPA